MGAVCVLESFFARPVAGRNTRSQGRGLVGIYIERESIDVARHGSFKVFELLLISSLKAMAFECAQ